MGGIGGARIDCFTDASPWRSGRSTESTDMHQQGDQLQEHYLPFPLPEPFFGPVLRGVALVAEAGSAAASAACVLDSEADWPSEERPPKGHVPVRRPPRPLPRPVRLPRPRPPEGLAILGSIFACQSR